MLLVNSSARIADIAITAVVAITVTIIIIITVTTIIIIAATTVSSKAAATTISVQPMLVKNGGQPELPERIE